MLRNDFAIQSIDKIVPIEEVFYYLVSVASEAVDTALSQLELLESAKKE